MRFHCLSKQLSCLLSLFPSLSVITLWSFNSFLLELLGLCFVFLGASILESWLLSTSLLHCCTRNTSSSSSSFHCPSVQLQSALLRPILHLFVPFLLLLIVSFFGPLHLTPIYLSISPRLSSFSQLLILFPSALSEHLPFSCFQQISISASVFPFPSSNAIFIFISLALICTRNFHKPLRISNSLRRS